MVNDISRGDIGFDAAFNEVVILSRDGGTRTVERTGKETVARAVLDEVERLRGNEMGEERDGARRTRSGAGRRA